MKVNEKNARMRTIESAYAELVAADPGCCLTKTALRRLVVTGEIKSVKVGSKYLVNLDSVDEYLLGCTSDSIVPASSVCVRRVGL